MSKVIVCSNNNYKNCLFQIHSKQSELLSCPITCIVYQQIRASCCGSFLDNWHASNTTRTYLQSLVVYLTTFFQVFAHPNVLRKTYTRGVQFASVTDADICCIVKFRDDRLYRYLQFSTFSGFIRTPESAIHYAKLHSVPKLELDINYCLCGIAVLFLELKVSFPGKHSNYVILERIFNFVNTNFTYFRCLDLRPESGNVILVNEDQLVTVLYLNNLSNHRYGHNSIRKVNLTGYHTK